MAAPSSVSGLSQYMTENVDQMAKAQKDKAAARKNIAAADAQFLSTLDGMSAQLSKLQPKIKTDQQSQQLVAIQQQISTLKINPPQDGVSRKTILGEIGAQAMKLFQSIR